MSYRLDMEDNAQRIAIEQTCLFVDTEINLKITLPDLLMFVKHQKFGLVRDKLKFSITFA